MASTIIPFGNWRGFVSTREKMALQPNELGPDSFEWHVSPHDGRILRRGGSQIQIDDVTGSPPAEIDGALESAWVNGTARAHQFVPLHSVQTNGYEIPSWVIADELNERGTLAWIDYDNTGFHQLGKEFDQTASGHYRQDGAAGEVRMKIIPYAEPGDGYGRFHSIAYRLFPLAGTRRAMELQSGLYSPGAFAAPSWWNKRYNFSATSGAQKMRFRPWGLDPPLWAPATTVPSTAAGNWLDGHTFYEAWAFEFEDGSVGPLFQVSTSATTPARGGLITVGTLGGTDPYPYRIISGIPLGPKGPLRCVARRGYRSKKEARTLSTDPLPDPSTLYPFVRIADNVTNTIKDYAALDDNLSTDASMFVDHTWPPRAQGAVAVNGKTVLWGNLRLNPYAILIAPLGAASDFDLNLDDENTAVLYQADFYHVRITATHLYLKKTVGGTTTTGTFIFSTYTTLQQLVDAINETTFVGTYDRWTAQLVPGVDGETPSTNLRATSDTGDEDSATVNTAPTDATTLNVRVYCPTYYFAAAFSETYLDTLPTQTEGLWLSAGDSGTGDGQYSLFRIRDADRKSPPGHAVGRCLGVEPCTGPGGVEAIVFYERARFALRNTKGGGSGDNADLKMVPLDLLHGSVSSMACFNGPGFAGTVGQDGVWVANGDPGASLVLSLDQYEQFPEPGQLSGELAFAIRTDAVLAAAGKETFTWAGVLGDKIRVRYRKNETTYTNNGMDYWFGQGQDAAGLAALMRDTEGGGRGLYGWSCPTRFQNVGVHGIAVTPANTGNSTVEDPSDIVPAARVFAWQDTNAGTNDGRVDQVDMDVIANDNGVDFTSSAFTACILAGDFEEIGILRIDPLWRKNGGTGILIILWGDIARASAADAITLASSGTAIAKRNTIEMSANVRGNKECVEMKIFDVGDGEGAVEVRRCPAIVEVGRAETRYA